MKKLFLQMKNLMLLTALLFSSLTQAAIIELKADKAEYQLGDTVEVQLLVSDAAELLGGFDTLVTYQAAGLTLSGWEFGDGFDDGLGSLQFSDDTLSGSLSLSDYAFLFSDIGTLTAAQSNGFVLATLRFTAATIGQFGVGAENTSLVSFDNEQIYYPGTSSLSIDIAAAEIPAPATLLLFLLGLTLIGIRHRG
jgi:hypothetical protein